MTDEQPKVSKTVALVVVLVSTFVMLGIAEVAVRLQGLAPELGRISVDHFQWSPNPELGYEPVPRAARATASSDRFKPTWRINRLGFRDRDHALAPEPGVFRIVVIGDSIAEGLGVDDDSAIFPALLEKRMAEAGHEIEVVNLAVRGYNTQQEVAMLVERGLAFQPDLVLLQYCANDVTQMDGGLIQRLREVEENGEVADETLMNPLLTWSAVYRLLFLGLIRDDMQNEHDQELKHLTENTVGSSFARLAEISREQGFPVFVVVFPRLEKRPVSRKYQGIYRLVVYQSRVDASKVQEYSANHGFMHLNLALAMERCRDNGESLAVDTLHPNERGHACAADAITQFLLRQEIPN